MDSSGQIRRPIPPWAPALFLCLFSMFIFAGAARLPAYVERGPAYLSQEERPGFTTDSPTWEATAYSLWARWLGGTPRAHWPPVPDREDLPPFRVLRPIYPLLGAVGLCVLPGDEVFRVVSLLGLLGSSLLLYGVARRLGLREAEAFVAAAVFTAASIPLRASLTAMADSTGVAFLLLPLWVFLGLRERLPGPGPLILLGLALFAGFLSSPMAAVLIPAFLIETVRDRPRLYGALAAVGIGTAAYGAYCLAIGYSPLAQWMDARAVTVAWHDLDPDMATSEFYAAGFHRTLRHIAYLFARPCWMLWVLAGAAGRDWVRRGDEAVRVGFVLELLSLGLLFLWGLGYAGLYSDRFFIYALPFLSLLAVAGLRTLWEGLSRLPFQGPSPLLLGLVLVLLSPHADGSLLWVPRPFWVWVLTGAAAAAALAGWWTWFRRDAPSPDRVDDDDVAPVL